MVSSSRSRRGFLKSAALAAPAIAGGLSAAAQTSAASAHAHPASAGALSSRNYLGKDTRLSIAMWDFSWLMGQYPGGAYADLERRLAEAAERGYNTLRVDCFPSRILESESTFPFRGWVPGKNLPQWGEVATAYTCNVRQKVAQLADLCRKHGLWLGLDSWDVAHMFRSTRLASIRTSGAPNVFSSAPSVTIIPVGEEERAFTAYGEIWVKALKLMREDGVLERAVWIAPMNEVPHFSTRGVEAIQAIDHKVRNEGETKLESAAAVDAIYRRINHSMAAPIRAEVAREHIPISYSSLGAEDYAARLTDAYDVVDLHCMPEVILDDDDKRAFLQAGHNAPFGVFKEFEQMDLKAYSAAWDRACRKHYPAMLTQVVNYFRTAIDHTTLPSGKKLQSIVTEAFGPCFWPDSPAVDWEWYKRYNADALRSVAGLDLTGATLSNYGEPLFELWNDAGWHWAGNNYFRTAPAFTL